MPRVAATGNKVSQLKIVSIDWLDTPLKPPTDGPMKTT